MPMLAEGTPAPYKKMADRKKLVGKRVVYLRRLDIDRSGRGMVFPRYGVVEAARPYAIEMDNGTWVQTSELVELNVLPDESAPTVSPS